MVKKKTETKTIYMLRNAVTLKIHLTNSHELAIGWKKSVC